MQKASVVWTLLWTASTRTWHQLLLSSHVPAPFSTAATALQSVEWQRFEGAAALFKHLAAAEGSSTFEQTMELVEQDTRATLRLALLSGWQRDAAGQEAQQAALTAQEKATAASSSGLQQLALLLGAEKAQASKHTHSSISSRGKRAS